MAKETTTNTTVELDSKTIDEILGVPGVSTDSIMTTDDGNDTEKKENFFSTADPVAKVLDSMSKPEAKKETKAEEKVDDVLSNNEETDKDVVEKILNNPATTSSKSDDNKQKMNKGTMISVLKKMMDDGKIIGFDDETPLENYSVEDIEELLEANLNAKEQQALGTVSKDFWTSLPEELQVAGKYLADGGTDLKHLFKVLAHTEEVKQIPIDDERGQEIACREYLRATNFGDDSDIEEEINAWKDRGELENKAKKFKPKLDQMQDQIIQQKLQQQESIKRQRDEAAKFYMENLATTLDKGELSGVKLDRKTQNFLWSGLLENNYPSVSGRPTNLFGHLIEKYQYVEPRHDLIAEALWLLADPDGYKAKVRQIGSNTQAEKTVRMLKTEQANKSSASVREEEQERGRSKAQPKLQRNNFFKRY